MSEQTLYRFFDSKNVLLYVGISINAYERAKQHRATKTWWPEVEFIKLEKFANRNDVTQAEKLAIELEKPKYNIKHQKKVPIDVWGNLNEISYKLSSDELAKSLQTAFKMWEQLKRAEADV